MVLYIADRSLFEAFINLLLYSLLCFKLQNGMITVEEFSDFRESYIGTFHVYISSIRAII